MENEQTESEGRIPKNGDAFVAVSQVDCGVSLFTLGFPFYDPKHPYLQQVIKGDRSVRFLFEKKSKIEGVLTLAKTLRGWNTAEEYTPPLTPLSVCKRTIWGRRNMLRDAKGAAYNNLQGLASAGEVVTDNLRLACVAYALGFHKPEKYLVATPAGASFIVGTKAPEWLEPQVKDLAQLNEMDCAGMSFIAAEGNELHPAAVGFAAFINIAAWIKHLSSELPYHRFNFGNNKTLLVQEGSPKFKELIDSGYSPE